MADGTYGKVVEQTPETVVVETLRGSWTSYPVADFLHGHPRNLSRNVFSVHQVLPVDYRLHHRVNREAVAAVKAHLEEELRKEPYGEHLIQVIVELKELGSSSLDVITIAKFGGEAGSEYHEIGWKLQQVALEASNRNGWEIPFNQLVVHSGNESPAPSPD